MEPLHTRLTRAANALADRLVHAVLGQATETLRALKQQVRALETQVHGWLIALALANPLPVKPGPWATAETRRPKPDRESATSAATPEATANAKSRKAAPESVRLGFHRIARARPETPRESAPRQPRADAPRPPRNLPRELTLAPLSFRVFNLVSMLNNPAPAIAYLRRKFSRRGETPEPHASSAAPFTGTASDHPPADDLTALPPARRIASTPPSSCANGPPEPDP